VYADAAATLEQARTALLPYTGWHAVERVVRAMENATRDDDADRMRELVAELESIVDGASHHSYNGSVAMPGNVAELTTVVLSRLGWRTRK
jgi:hypothetical protein